ncbi:polyprenol phosphomannose-dependent alpha 1,6 mannosyltransferase MptB [Nesterenkonia flava]|uniref:Polyprenol phosphomannose-dependent alpha 1,6 mannosyltransferase MptB n=1 Tax=Nesterenkonia flava TaxID=469799 RepID=A0ABU1FVN0_9MICC|nr:polyprenol phosphomannose-dependent alpha 1,6 mannosyltransferase MptB [Nesterenkonia flava]MDR5712382.1 polyprenol phosphomannose-dependent alpha 1,6 mannosyltransferase MptB [Nesterenkonia flava]
MPRDPQQPTAAVRQPASEDPVDAERPRLSSPGTPRALIQGFLGSMLVLFGSFGVGWLANASALNRSWWVIPLRTEPAGVALSTVALTLGCWVMFHAWLLLGRALREAEQRSWRSGSLRIVNIATAVWSLPHLFCVPIFSRDVYAYVNQGRLVLAGQDPYQVGVSQLDNWFHFGTDMMWAHSETPYGPMFLWIEAAVMRMTGLAVDPAVFLFRLACVIGVVLIMIYVPKLARLYGGDPGRAQWLSAANPLFIISFISSAHNDALMMGFALAGIYAAATADRTWLRGVLAAVLVAVSVGMKIISMVLLPFIGLLWAAHLIRKYPGVHAWFWRFLCWFATAGISGVILLVVGLINGYGFGWLLVLAGTGDTGKSFWSPMGIIDDVLSTILQTFGLDASWTLDTVRVIGRLLSVIIVLILMFVGRDKHILHRMTWAFTALVVLSPIIHPWYLLWLLPLFAVIGIRNDWQTKWVVFTVGFFICYGAQDQLSVWSFLDLDEEMLRLSLGTSVVAMLVIALLPSSRWVWTRGWWASPIMLRIPRTQRVLTLHVYDRVRLEVSPLPESATTTPRTAEQFHSGAMPQVPAPTGAQPSAEDGARAAEHETSAPRQRPEPDSPAGPGRRG